MKTRETSIPGVLVIEPRVFGDSRGWFLETYQRERYAAAGIGRGLELVQDNMSSSVQNTLRGLHYQLRRPQGKLVSVTYGAVLDVAVDLRRGSPTLGRWVATELSAENHHQVWIPPGFAHGFLVLSERAEVQYKTTDFYAPDDERSIRYDDADLAIRWPLSGPPILSARDQVAGSFRDAELPA